MPLSQLPANLLHNLGGGATGCVSGWWEPRVTAHAGSGYLSSSALMQHFGLGPHSEIEWLEVHWSSGERSRLTNPTAVELVTVVEPR
jgi:hypothetical protein